MSFTTDLTDDLLIDRLDNHLKSICNRVLPVMSIPAKPNEDFDLLLAELLIRFMKKDEELTHYKCCSTCNNYQDSSDGYICILGSIETCTRIDSCDNWQILEGILVR